MRSQSLLAAALAALTLLTGACRASGSFLLFGGGSATPQEGLVRCVRAAQQDSQDARQDFSEAFRLYQRLTTPQAVELESLAEDFGDALETCQERGEELDEHLEAVREEAGELFDGWNAELGQFSSEAMRKKSEAMLQETQARTQRVLAALERAQQRMQPVQLKLADYALFFHHNLNARAIATLEDTYRDFDAEFRALDAELGKVELEIASFLAHFEPPAPTPAK